MKKTRLVTGLMAFVVTLVIIIAGSILLIDTLSEKKLTEENEVALKSVSVETVEKSMNQTDKLESSLLETNTEDALPVQVNTDGNTKLVIESNNSVKTTKKKSKKNKKNKNNRKKKKIATRNSKRLKSGYVSAGTYKITGYCACSSCCGKSTGITASGTRAKAGRTIAADTSVLPFGTKVKINGHVYTVEDKGGAINGNRIDLFFSSHSKALEWGVRYIDIYVKK